MLVWRDGGMVLGCISLPVGTTCAPFPWVFCSPCFASTLGLQFKKAVQMVETKEPSAGESTAEERQPGIRFENVGASSHKAVPLWWWFLLFVRQGAKARTPTDTSPALHCTEDGGAEATAADADAEMPRRAMPRHTLSMSQKARENIKSLKPPAQFGTLALMVPLAAVVGGIRFRHAQICGHGGYGCSSDDDHNSYSSYSSSSYASSSYSSYSSYSSSSAYGGDDHGSGGYHTIFTLAQGINGPETALCFTGIIGCTMLLDLLIEHLNELCEHGGHVYISLARSLYQELMLLGIISFCIFLLNAEVALWPF